MRLKGVTNMINFFKRAWFSVTRRKGKTIILFLVVFLLGNAIAGAIAINQATISVEKNIKSQLGAKATIEMDYERYYNENEVDSKNDAPEPVGIEVIEAVGALPQVKYFDYSLDLFLYTKELEPWAPEDASQDRYFYSGEEGNGFSLKGVQRPTTYELETGEMKMVQGRFLTDAEINEGKAVVVVSKDLAEANNLSLQSTIIFQNNAYDYSAEDMNPKGGEMVIAASQDVVLEVVGIFEPTLEVPKEQQGNDMGMDMTLYNNIDKNNKLYVPNKVIQAEEKFTEEMQILSEEMGGGWPSEWYQSQYVLNSPDEVEAFKEAAQPLLPEYYLIYASSDDYEQIAGSMKTMASLSKMVLIVAVVATILILSLLVILFIRDRKHEFGIYLALGDAKINVILQVVVEVLMVSIIAMSLSLVTGNMMARGVSQSMIQYQLESKEDYGYSYSRFGDTTFTEDDVVEQYQVGFTPQYVMIYYAVGIVTIILATGIPMLYILRLNPKKILM